MSEIEGFPQIESLFVNDNGAFLVTNLFGSSLA
jgi:hypothetical protein